MLSQAIGDLLPSAVGVALSPLPVVAAVIMLGTPRARVNGPAFAVGWIGGLAIVSAVVLTVASGADEPDSVASTTVHWGKLALGVVLLLLAARKWRRRPRKGETVALPGWMTAVDHFSPGKALVLGAALSGLNPKNLVLTMAAAASIAEAGLGTGDSAIAAAVFVVIGSLTVAGPVVAHLVARDRVVGPLASLKDFMADNSAVIMIVILVILGAKLIGDAIPTL